MLGGLRMDRDGVEVLAAGRRQVAANRCKVAFSVTSEDSIGVLKQIYEVDVIADVRKTVEHNEDRLPKISESLECTPREFLSCLVGGHPQHEISFGNLSERRLVVLRTIHRTDARGVDDFDPHKIAKLPSVCVAGGSLATDADPGAASTGQVLEERALASHRSPHQHNPERTLKIAAGQDFAD